MWDDLLRVDWNRLVHAYGRARDVPKMLRDLVSADPAAREKGWGFFWNAVNHQGNFYNATVASIPFLVEAAGWPEVPDLARILRTLRNRWLDAPTYDADPMLDVPPGGVDEPTPMLADGVTPRADESGDYDPDKPDVEEFDPDLCRKMVLCAWQVGRAIRAGRPTYERLTDNPDRAIAAAAAELLLLWPETRAHGKRALIRAIEHEPDPVEQARRILVFGVHGDAADAATYELWVDPGRPEEVRAAAALAWAWMVDPELPPGPAARVLFDASADDSDILARLPSEGIWQRGLWSLPSNICGLILRLTGNRVDKLRWRAVQSLGLRLGREVVRHLPDERVVPVLIERLSDSDDRVRASASHGLSQRGASVFAIEPGVVPALIHALDDEDPSVCGHSARLLAALSDRLTSTQRDEAQAGVERAALRFAGRHDSCVRFDSMSFPAARFLEKQVAPIRRPPDWGVRELFAEIAFPRKQDGRLPLIECDRRLADAYAEDRARLIATAIEAVRDAGDREVSIGAADWLATLGPAAAPALPALEVMNERKGDPYVPTRACDSIAFIRRSMEIGSDSVAGTSDFLEALNHPHPIVRARSACWIAAMPLDAPVVADAIPALVRLLDDEAFAEPGVEGRFEFQGLLDPGPRLHHWHQKRWSPRAEAIRALFSLGRIPDGDRMLRAMIAESMHAEVICARRASAPHRFEIGAWRSAVAAAGGALAAVRAARDRCRERVGSGQDIEGAAFACKAELDEVLRRLSGRLGGGR